MMNTVQNSKLTLIILGGEGQPPFVVAAREQAAPPAVLRAGEDRIVPGETSRIARAGQTLRVVSGCAWITFGGEDRIVLPGEDVLLEPGDDAAVVSALEETPLVYRLYGEA